MVSLMSLGIIGFESYDFVVTDLARSRRFYVDLLDFREVARGSAARTSATGEEAAVFRAGKVQVQVSSPLHQRSRAARFLKWHPDGIREVSFRVKDLDATWAFLSGRGATPVSAIETHDAAPGRYRHFAITTAVGDVTFRFVERTDWPGFAPGFDDVAPTDEGNRFDLRAIDHITINLLTLTPTITWFREVLGFEQFWEVRFHTDDVRKGASGSGLKSIVMRDPHSPVKFASNEPMAPFFEASQIHKFVEDHRGPGIQHVAFITPHIIPAVRGMQQAGIRFLGTPASYYRMLPSRLTEVGISASTIKESMTELESLGILIDGHAEKYMLQIFLQEGGVLYDDPRAGPFFYEVIQRAGDPGFGGGNFRALFESIERDQLSRAHLDQAT